jgi:hypothetical protein
LLHPTIQNSIVNSNASIQASNVLEIFELEPTPLLPTTPLMFSILTEENPNTISAQFQKNQ